MNNILLISSFLATGAAWGMAWLGGFGVLKKDMGSAPLLKMVSLVFTVAGSIFASYVVYDLYGTYSVGTEEEKALFKSGFTGKDFVKNTGGLLIHLSPVVLILPAFRKSRVICAVAGICYILLPFYNRIIEKLGV